MKKAKRGRSVLVHSCLSRNTVGVEGSWASEVQRDHLEKMPPSGLHKVFVFTLIRFEPSFFFFLKKKIGLPKCSL